MTKIKTMTKVEKTPKTTKKVETIEELTATRDAAIVDLEEKQVKLTESKYSMDFDNVANISRVMKHLDKSTKWMIKDAALTINLYDNIKLEKARIKALGEEKTIVELGAVDLNTLYKSLTVCEGYGIENAKAFITLLTNLGSQISSAMEKLSVDNQKIQGMHVELAELDKAIEDMSTEKVEADEIIE
jgi:hypothetical protein|tara:strand:+ start:7768 stop:8328 length:561 start_codon:yes stop_codon:yes gene_type:complete